MATVSPAPNPVVLQAIFLVQLPLMILFPLLVGLYIKRHYGVAWRVYALGMATFVLSQIVHIPLNMALGLIDGGRGVALWPIVPMAIVAGFSAGLCEEGARWIVLTFFAKRTRGWRAGLQYGAGHGGAEAIIFGTLVLINVLFMIVLSTIDPAQLGLAGTNGEQIAAAQLAYWATPPYMFVVGGLERVFAIALQIAFASLVMRGVMRRQPIYLLAAILMHAAVDFWAVWGMQQFRMWVVEAGVALAALAGLWLIRRLREEEPAAESAYMPGAPRSAADLAPRGLTPEELSQRAEASRYE